LLLPTYYYYCVRFVQRLHAHSHAEAFQFRPIFDFCIIINRHDLSLQIWLA